MSNFRVCTYFAKKANKKVNSWWCECTITHKTIRQK